MSIIAARPAANQGLFARDVLDLFAVRARRASLDNTLTKKLSKRTRPRFSACPS